MLLPPTYTNRGTSGKRPGGWQWDGAVIVKVVVEGEVAVQLSGESWRVENVEPLRTNQNSVRTSAASLTCWTQSSLTCTNVE